MSVPAAMLQTDLTLQALLRGLADAPPIALTDISADSRQLAPGSLFIACQGGSAHGLDFLQQAIAAQVAAVAWDSSTASARAADVPMVPVANLASELGVIANRWFDEPSARLKVTGVTGTNGKTTIAWLLKQSLQIIGRRSAYIGTLGGGLDEPEYTGGMTTPACIELHRLLAGFAAARASHVALEVSSHALHQGRVDGVRFDTAIFTNLSRDHIDYHGSMRAYGDAKARLFLDRDVAHRIVCVDSAFGRELADRIGPDAVTVATNASQGRPGRQQIAVDSVTSADGGSRIAFTSSWGGGEVVLPLPGQFNVANAMQVLATLLCWDIPLAEACAVLGKVSAPPGRMERVVLDTGDALPAVFVDFAHTPASLEVALQELRRHCSGDLWCVFGCGGDRDRGKRPLMGEIAARLADHAIVTNDNPRTEPPAQIIADILEGMADDTAVFEDRAVAIAHAVTNAAAGDVVLLAGKGHEDYQVIGTEVSSFSDYDVARACLATRSGKGA